MKNRKPFLAASLDTAKSIMYVGAGRAMVVVRDDPCMTHYILDCNSTRVDDCEFQKRGEGFNPNHFLPRCETIRIVPLSEVFPFTETLVWLRRRLKLETVIWSLTMSVHPGVKLDTRLEIYREIEPELDRKTVRFFTIMTLRGIRQGASDMDATQIMNREQAIRDLPNSLTMVANMKALVLRAYERCQRPVLPCTSS